jgi:hypothetical protein
MKKVSWFLIGLIGTFLVLYLMANRMPEGSYDLKFQQQLWQQKESSVSPEGDIALRQKMVADVIKNILPGKNRSEVLSLLGPPTETKSDQFLYVLGRERGYTSIDYEWLRIRFEGEKIKNIRLITD